MPPNARFFAAFTLSLASDTRLHLWRGCGRSTVCRRVRYIFVPVVILAGYWMYSGAVFAITGVALWLGAYRLSGFGAALVRSGRAIHRAEDLVGNSCATFNVIIIEDFKSGWGSCHLQKLLSGSCRLERRHKISLAKCHLGARRLIETRLHCLRPRFSMKTSGASWRET